MNYQIITDEVALREFIDWLPELESHEQYYCCLLSRSKYTKDSEGKNGLPHIKSDKAQLRRFTSTKERLFDKIKQLEVPLGSYKQGKLEIPQEALALYITINPRDMWKATKQSAKHFLNLVISDSRLNNPHQEAMSEIQKSVGKRHYRIFDLDSKDSEKLEEVLSIINPEACKIIETRGGYHILVKPKYITKSGVSTWFKKVIAIEGIDSGETNNDMLCPVVGTIQGGFTPKFISCN